MATESKGEAGAATERPWVVLDEPGETTRIHDDAGRLVCRMHGAHMDSNAALIVSAVNGHTALVAALEGLLARIDNGEIQQRAYIGAGRDDREHAAHDAAVKAAHAALSAAREGMGA